MADPQNISDMLVRIEATTAGLRRELDKGDAGIKKFSSNAEKSTSSVGKSFEGLASSVAKIAAPVAAAALAMEGLRKAVEVQRQFDKLNAGLVTATGSTEKAAIAFGALQDFAAKTPYSLDQAVEGFTKLVNLGLTPSEKALMSYGNTAAAMGKDLNQMIEAVADAATGEFERLKEFGITSSQQGDKVSLTFRGVSTTIGKNAKEIEGYLMNLGLVDFAGAMEQRADTLDGKISNLGDTWDQTFRLINEKGLGEVMKDAVSTAGDALQELNNSLASGQFEAYLAAMGDNFDGWTTDLQQGLIFLDKEFGIFFGGVGAGAKASGAFLVEAFRDMPENVRAFIQLMTVEVLAGFDKAQAYAIAFKDSIAAVFSNDTFADVQKRLDQSLEATNSVRQGSIESILEERDAVVQSFKDQTAAADERMRKYQEERKAAATSSKDRLIDFSKQVEGAKAAGAANKELENKLKQQKKALDDLIASSKIAFDAAQGLANGYLAGKDLLYQYTLQQRVEQELLKTGAEAREKVTAAIQAQMDAEARQDVAKGIYQLRLETDSLNAQALATLQGTDALNAYNAEKAVAAALAGKNADALSAETKLMLEAVQANQQAAKTAEQVGKVQSIMDRLKPESALLRQYTEDQKALNEAIRLNPEAAAEYAESLRILGLEYEQNRAAATAWGQFTEGAIDRVDDAFADAWKNIGKGFDGFATSLKDGFKQLLAELAHMAITKPIIMQIGAALGVGGLSASQGMGMLGGGGSGGGLNIVSLAQNAYSVYSGLTGVGSAIYGGYQVGGLTGAAQAGVGYYGNMLSNGANYVSGLFGGASGAAAGSAAASSAAGATAAGYTGQAYSTWAAGQYASQAASKVASTISSYGPYFAAIAGALQGWQAAGFKGAVAGAGGAVGGMYAGAQLGSYFGPIGTAIGGAIGAVAGAAFGSKLFGGQWQTKDAGLSLGVEGGDLSATGFEYQKKKGGLFGKNKKRTVFNALDADTQAALDMTFDAGMDQIQALYEQFGIDVSQSALDGLSIAATQISTKGKTTEELQKLIGDWFTGTFDSITDQINTAMGSQFRAGLTLDGLKLLLGNLISVNGMLDLLNVGVLKITPAGAYAAEALTALAGGMDKLTANVNTYYDAFFTEAEKQADTLAAVNAQFQAMGVSLPALRQGYRDIVSAIDVTTAAGQAMFTSLTSLAGQADAYYDVIEARQQALLQQVSGYYDQFTSEAQKSADVIASITQQFAAANVALPASREAFKAIVEALDQTSASGKSTFETLMGLAAQADSYYDILESQSQAIAQALAEAQASMLSTALGALQRAVNKQQNALQEAYNARTEALNASLASSQSAVSSLASMTDGLASALKEMLGQSEQATRVLYGQATATLETAAAIARAGGSLANFQGLDDALSTVTGNNSSGYGDWLSFARDQGRSASLIGELSATAGDQLTSAEKTVKGIQDQLDLSKKQFDLESKMLQGQLDLAQAQIDAINGVDNTLLSIAEALAQFGVAIKTASPNGTGSMNADSLIEAAYQSSLGRGADKAGADYWKQQLASGAVSSNNLQNAISQAGAANGESINTAFGNILGYAPDAASLAYWQQQVANGNVTDINAAIRAAAMQNGQIPAFAAGGLYGGGLALVGEKGPELINFNKPGYVHTAADTASMMGGGSNAALLAEVRAMRAELTEMKYSNSAIAKHTRKTADGIQQQNEVGVATLETA